MEKETKVKAARFSRILLVCAGSVGLIAWLGSRWTVEVPDMQRIADLAAGSSTTEVRPRFDPPYHLVIGVPGSSETPPPFRGVIQIYGPDRMVCSVPISSEAVQSCNWLHDPAVAGFLVAGNASPSLSAVFQRGAASHVRIFLSEPLPAGCSLWLGSMKHVSIINLTSFRKTLASSAGVSL